MSVWNVGNVSVTTQTSLPTGESTLERDPMNVGNVGRASIRAQVLLLTRESTREKNPMDVLSVGANSTIAHVLVHVREPMPGRDSRCRGPVLKTLQNLPPKRVCMALDSIPRHPQEKERELKTQSNRPYFVSLTQYPLGL